MYRKTTDGSLDNEAVKIANAFKPFFKKWFEEWGRNCIRCKKMTVTTAPSSGVIGVTDAFSDTEILIPYMSRLEDAVVGDVVWCKWMFGNMQTLYADSIVGDMDSGGGGGVTIDPYNSNPEMDGTASSGSSAKYSRGDHVHPKDTSKADVNSPAFTGIPTAPTAASGTNTTQIATTAFVHTEVGSINAVPSGGTAGQVLTKTASGYAWQSLPVYNGGVT